MAKCMPWRGTGTVSHFQQTEGAAIWWSVTTSVTADPRLPNKLALLLPSHRGGRMVHHILCICLRSPCRPHQSNHCRTHPQLHIGTSRTHSCRHHTGMALSTATWWSRRPWVQRRRSRSRRSTGHSRRCLDLNNYPIRLHPTSSLHRGHNYLCKLHRSFACWLLWLLQKKKAVISRGPIK